MILDKRTASYSRFFTSPNGLAFRNTALECGIQIHSKSHLEDLYLHWWSCVERHVGPTHLGAIFSKQGMAPLYKMAIHAAIGGCGRLTDTPTRTRIRLPCTNLTDACCSLADALRARSRWTGRALRRCLFLLGLLAILPHLLHNF